MLFLTLNNANVQFIEKKLIWRFYITAEALPTTKRVELIDKKKFAKKALNENFETFVTYVTSLASISVHLKKETYIAFLFNQEVKILDKYSDFVNVFLKEKSLILPEQTKLNKYAINLKDGKQPFYRLIYSL